MGKQYLAGTKSVARFGICLLLSGVLAGAVVFAAVDDEFEEATGARLNQRRDVMALSMLIQRQSNAAQFKHQWMAKLGHLDRVCHLSATQKQKLALAAAGDSKRHNDAFETLKAQCLGLQPDDLTKSDELIQELQALQRRRANPFNEGSLFDKTLNRLLDREQLAALGRQPSRDDYGQLVTENLPALGNRIGLRPEQYPALTELLTWETDPPKKYGRFEYMYLVYQISKVPTDKLKPLLDDRQQARLAQQYVANAESFLIQRGILDEPARADDPAELLPAEAQPGTEPPAQPSGVQP